MWNLPRPGLEPVSPALAGGFLTTAPPGKPDNTLLMQCTVYDIHTGNQNGARGDMQNEIYGFVTMPGGRVRYLKMQIVRPKFKWLWG